MRKKLVVILAGIMCLGMWGCGTDAVVNDVLDQVANVAQSEDENVLSVKNGTNRNCPGVTYGEAFEEFFGTPTWKYFKGTQDGPDDDGDGQPDYINEDIDVIEFTGYCMYADKEVKALIQFTLDKDAGTFKETYLSFNDVPQSTLTLAGLIESVFESYMEDHDVVVDSQSEENQVNNDAEDASDAEGEDGTAADEIAYPEDMNYYAGELDPTKVSGNYGGVLGQSYAEVNIYGSPDNEVVGKADIYLDSEIENYGGCEYTGELIKLDTNLYSMVNNDNHLILLAMNYDADSDTTYFEFWFDNENLENYYFFGQYE